MESTTTLMMDSAAHLHQTLVEVKYDSGHSLGRAELPIADGEGAHREPKPDGSPKQQVASIPL